MTTELQLARWRLLAEECRAEAAILSDQAMKDDLIRIAVAYERLAAALERRMKGDPGKK